MNNRSKYNARPGLIPVAVPTTVLALLALAGMVAATGTAFATGPYHDHADIRRAAEAAATARMSTPRSRVAAKADDIDARLRLAACDAPLQASIPYDTRRKSRLTAEVRCPGSSPWKLYVPVRLQVWQKVLVAAGPLQRGKLLEPGDVILAERTVSEQARGFVLDPRHAVGYRLKRDLSEGEVITPGVIVAPPLIERGQAVTIEAKSSGVRVQMAGIALQDGLAGDIIRVENRESGRQVEGVVRSGKTVEVLLH